MAGAGQTLNDRLLAAKHSLAGQGLAKAVCKATTEELIGPKRKHLECEYTGPVHLMHKQQQQQQQQLGT